jgi:hypothetical protein
VKARIGGIIYWLLAGIAFILIATSSASYPRSGSDIGQIVAGGIIYIIGRDMRRVLRE